MTNTSTATSEADEATALTTDERLWVSASKERRAVLEVLDPTETPVGVRDLARAVVDEVQSADSVDRLATKLHHKHLPLLDQLDVIEYAHDQTRVTAYRPLAESEE